MQELVVAIILASVVAGILFPYLKQGLQATREAFSGPKPQSATTRLLQKMKDNLKND